MRDQRSEAFCRHNVRKQKECWSCYALSGPENKELWTSSWVELQLQYGAGSLSPPDSQYWSLIKQNGIWPVFIIWYVNRYDLSSLLIPGGIHTSRINKPPPLGRHVRICYATRTFFCLTTCSVLHCRVILHKWFDTSVWETVKPNIIEKVHPHLLTYINSRYIRGSISDW